MICWLLIIPVKAMRFIHGPTADTLLMGIAPSVLGPAGLFFLIPTSPGRLSHLSLLQVAIVTTTIALGLEFAQLLPRPGILSAVYYTFDWLDILASLLSVCVSYIIAYAVTKR
jgi:hypothetical protein